MKIIIEAKAVRHVADKHRAQVFNDLRATGIRLGPPVRCYLRNAQFEPFPQSLSECHFHADADHRSYLRWMARALHLAAKKMRPIHKLIEHKHLRMSLQ